MTAVLPESLLGSLATTPRAGEWYPIYELLSADAGGPPAVCLLSAVEIRATSASVSVASRSRRLATNLETNPTTTLVAWEGNLHYITLALETRIELEGVGGYRFAVQDVRVDDIGIATRPLQYEMQERLIAIARWELTHAVLDELDDLPH